MGSGTPTRVTTATNGRCKLDASDTDSSIAATGLVRMSEATERNQFKFGNSAWKARSSHGRKPKFASPEAIESACQDYFQWVDDNPLMVVELVKYQGQATQVSVPKMRAMTIVGLCNFLDIGTSTWNDYKTKPDFSDITGRIEAIIYQQKFEGAAADMFNANIISRELGLADKKELGGNLSLKQALDAIDGQNTGLPDPNDPYIGLLDSD